MKKFVLSATLLAFAAACGESNPTGVAAEAGSATGVVPASGPHFHLANGEGGGQHADLKPEIATPYPNRVIELPIGATSGTVTFGWNTAPLGTPGSYTTFVGYEYELTKVCPVGNPACFTTRTGRVASNVALEVVLEDLTAGTYTARVRGRGEGNDPTATNAGRRPGPHASSFTSVQFTVALAEVGTPPPVEPGANVITFDLTGATLTPAVTALPAKTYGDAHFDIGAYVKASSELDVTLTVAAASASVCEISDGAWVTIKSAGPCVIAATQDGKVGDEQKYLTAQAVTRTINIARATPAFANAAIDNNTYDTQQHAAVATVNGVGTPAEALGAATVTYALRTGAGTADSPYAYATAASTAPTNAGAYKVTFTYAPVVGTLQHTNYNGISADTYTLTIARKALTVTAVANPSVKTYDGQGFATSGFSANYSGFAGTEAESVLTGTLAFSTPNASGNTNTYPGAGDYLLTPSGLSSPNYSITFAAANLKINKARATIEFGNLAQAFNGAAKTITATTTPAGLSMSTPVYTDQSGATVAPSAVGIYKVTATITDPNYFGTETGYLAIYDPSAGFVTGGGWIKYDASACKLNACITTGTLTADFGFNSKYQKGANIPTGYTRFEFNAGMLNFASSSYEWLVVAGTRAQFKGVGTINGRGNYGFLLTAVDGGTGGMDSFRMKIWDRDQGGDEDNTVFDNGAETQLNKITGNGSIVIHAK